jgi:uncharacterized protein (TIGR02268 family)
MTRVVVALVVLATAPETPPRPAPNADSTEVAAPPGETPPGESRSLSRRPSLATGRKTPRELRRRSIQITDASLSTIPEVHVGGGVPTTVAFETPLKEDAAVLSDPHHEFFPLHVVGQTLILVPKKDLAPGEVRPLSVAFPDGTTVLLQLASSARDVDLEVDVEVNLPRKAAGASAPALKEQISVLQARLDDCKGSSGEAGIAKVASLVLAEASGGRSETVLERRPVHSRDKSERLLVETKAVYRLFGEGYLVLTVENRDGDRVWVLDRPEIAVTGQAKASVKVDAFTLDKPSLAPGEVTTLVVAFPIVERPVDSRFAITLFEKNGSRHAVLDGVSL